jgi:hypothetical protein
MAHYSVYTGTSLVTLRVLIPYHGLFTSFPVLYTQQCMIVAHLLHRTCRQEHARVLRSRRNGGVGIEGGAGQRQQERSHDEAVARSTRPD